MLTILMGFVANLKIGVSTRSSNTEDFVRLNVETKADLSILTNTNEISAIISKN